MTHQDGTDSVWECCGAWECVCAVVSASDPVEVALGKAWSGLAIQRPSAVFAAEAVRAFAKPLRELHKPTEGGYIPLNIRCVDQAHDHDEYQCFTCTDNAGGPKPRCAHCDLFWPCATAVLIYPEQELS